MDTFKIRAFLAAVRYKSFSRAAEEFSYTPSAFSHMAHSLNEELGIVLFKRTTSGIELTKEGEIICEKFNAMMETEDDILKTASKLSENKNTKLRIGSYSSISRFLLPEILKRFKESNPDIKVSLMVSANLRGWVEKDVADIVFCDRAASFSEEWLSIMDDPFVAVVPSSLFPGRKSINFEELYEHSYISTRETIFKDRIDESRFKDVIPFASEDDAAVISMVSEGIGVAILPRLTLGTQKKGVKTLSLEPEISRTLGITYKKNPAPSAQKFVEFMKENYAEKYFALCK